MITAYHGTCYNIKNFNIGDYQGFNTGNNGGAVFFSDDVRVALSYSRECFSRKNEYLFDFHGLDSNILADTAEKQQFCYSVELDIKSPLILDIKQIESNFFKKRGQANILDSSLLNHIINILQNRQFEKSMELYDMNMDEQALELLLPYIEEYDEEHDEYVEKNINFDSIIIKNCIDSIDDISHYIESTVMAVLDTSIIKNIKKIRG